MGTCYKTQLKRLTFAVVNMAVWLAENGYLWKNGEFRNIKENKEN